MDPKIGIPVRGRMLGSGLLGATGEKSFGGCDRAKIGKELEPSGKSPAGVNLRKLKPIYFKDIPQ